MHLAALCYHAVSPTWDWRYAITQERLEHQLRVLLRRRYRPTTLSAALAGPGRGRMLAVTFDDAHQSVLDLALPVLDALGVPATVFAVTEATTTTSPLTFGRLGHFVGTAHEAELAVMSWHDLAKLRDAGWEIGSHSRTHPRLSRLTDEVLAGELAGSRAACVEALGVACTAFAYPYGDVDARVAAAVRAAGYTVAAAVGAPGAVPGDAYRLPRIPVHRDDGPAAPATAASPARAATARVGRSARRALTRVRSRLGAGNRAAPRG